MSQPIKMSNLNASLTNFNGNPPVSEAAVTQFAEATSMELTIGYKRFLRIANGGEGFIGKDRYVILWRLEELVQLNETYRVGEYAPELFLFGTNGGGEAFGFDTRPGSGRSVVSVPFIGMDITLARPIGSDFEIFLEGQF